MCSARIVFVTLVALSPLSCKVEADPAAAQTFTDNFDHSALGKNWNFQGGSWRIVDGQLSSTGDKNVALWSRHPLPRDVEISFDATSHSAAVDLKCELFGDGQTHQSGYIIINGGWNNSTSIIARRREHELDKVPFDSVPYKRRAGLLKDHTYHWRIVRRGDTITQYLDGEKYLERSDPQALYGPENNKFGFNNWAAQVRFDNLKIQPL